MRKLRAAGVCLVVASGLMVALVPPAAQAAPAFQLPFECGQQWRLDTWGHNPALDMVREPDQAGTEGAALLAPAAGTVNQSYYHDNAGNMIQINHGGGHFTTYLHLQSRAVTAGTTVARGQLIGRVGKTGPTSNGHPHLHYEQGFDSDGNGSVTWGFAGAERVPATFDGVTYTGSSRTWRNVTSRNCGAGGMQAITGTMADVNNDAKNDLMVKEAATGDIWVYPGIGAPGTTAWGTRYLACGGCGGFDTMDVADLNNDGKTDLMVREAASGDIWVYPGIGASGSTVWGSRYRACSGCGGFDAVNVGDLNNDAKTDLVLREAASGDIWVYPGIGAPGTTVWGTRYRACSGCGGFNDIN